jgi:hypothetical protein
MGRILPLLALAALAASLAGCGGGKGDPVVSAAKKSETAGGTRVTTRVTVRFPSGGEGVITGEGTFGKEEGEMTLDMSNLLQNSPLPLGSGSGIEARYLEEAGHWILYLNVPFLSKSLPKGKTWVRIDLQKEGASLGANFSELLGQAGQNPAQALELLQVSGPSTRVGADIIGGMASTQYRTKIDLKRALELNGVSRPGIRRLISSSASNVLPADVWVGKDGLVRQLRTTSVSAMTGQRVSTATLTTLTGWGKHVDVQAPPDGKVYDVTRAAPAGTTA